MTQSQPDPVPELEYPTEENDLEALWDIPGVAEIRLDFKTETVHGMHAKGLPETVPRRSYDPLTIEEIIDLATEYRLALRDGRLLAELIDPHHPAP
jgi:hypothetical protein